MFRRKVQEALLQNQENNQTELSRLEINEKKIERRLVIYATFQVLLHRIIPN